MQREALVPDGVTFVSILKACGGMGDMDAGKRIHDEVVSRGLIKENIVLGTALVDMYAKCGLFAKAHQVLEDLDVRDVVSWSALIAGCAQGGQGHEALNCFVRMQKEGIAPNEVTFTSVLQACGSIGAIDEGKQIHESLISKGLIGRNAFLSVSLIDMYVNCGAIERAREVVDKLVVRDTISWSALICGYAKKGHFSEALLCFKQMEEEGISPNEITFVCVLAACCHSGKSIEAQSYYENIGAKYGLTPTTEHHTCMVAIFGVSGQFDKAISVIQTMPSSGDPSVWLTLLASCRKWGNVGLGSLAFHQIIQMDSKLPAAFVLMASVFAVVGMQEDAEKVLSMRNELFFGSNCSSQYLVNLRKHIT
jgi:pentatricopeptide repeat protein